MGKFNNIIDLQADETVEADGVDINFGKGRVITIRRSSAKNREYKAAMSRVFKPHQKIGGMLTIDDESAEKLLVQVYSETVVVGWKGFIDDKGAQIPFSRSNCIELLTDAPEVFEHIKNESARFSNFAKEDIEQAGK